jgi:hypothetical protein
MQQAWKGGRGGASDTTAADEQQQAAQAAEKKPEPSEALSECPHTVKLLLEFLKASDPSWEKQDKSCIMVLHEFSTRKNLQVRLPHRLTWRSLHRPPPPTRLRLIGHESGRSLLH